MSGPVRFRNLRKLLGPRWLTTDDDGNPDPVGYSLDLVKDAFVERVRLGLLARLPQNDPTGQTTAPPDALEAMGRDRRVIRGINESDQAYAVRLKRWLDDRQRAGNPFALMQKLAEYTGAGPSFRTVDARGNWYSRSAAGVETALLQQGNWNWDGPTAGRWSRFWVIIYPNGLWTTEVHTWNSLGDPTWGFNPTTDMLGVSATQEHVATLRHLVSDWKPEHARCVNIILAFDPASFNPATPEPDGNWGSWSKYTGGVRVPARLSTARYLDGV